MALIRLRKIWINRRNTMNRNRVLLAFIGICLIAAAACGRTGQRGGPPANGLDFCAAAVQNAQGRGAAVGNAQTAWWTDTALMAG